MLAPSAPSASSGSFSSDSLQKAHKMSKITSRLTAYRAAVAEFDKLPMRLSPGDKLKQYLRVSRAICDCVDEYAKKQKELAAKRAAASASASRRNSLNASENSITGPSPSSSLGVSKSLHDELREEDEEENEEEAMQRMEEAVIGADDLLLLFALVIVRGRCNLISGVHAELKFVEDLMSDSQRSNAAACYYHATFQAATELLRTIDKADIMSANDSSSS
jgi:hypothetical protein